MRLLMYAATAALMLHSPAGATAQQAPAQYATVSGGIIDSETGASLAYASATLEPVDPGALPARNSPFLQLTRTVVTDEAGQYRFQDIVPGDYRLHVQRIGYRSRTVELRVRTDAEARVSIALQVEPVALEPVDVSGESVADVGNAYARRARDERDIEAQGRQRLAAERLRQRLHLGTDVRTLTHADVTEGITLGETDLFRAFHRLPGVSTGDDWSAELWTRGATWDQTRVYFDGIPVFNALHALGIFSGINPDVIGAAFMHPGTQPARLGGGAAGSLDLRSRPGTGSRDLNGLAELSLASARLALDRRTEDRRFAWMIAARRTYLDVLTRLAERVVDEPAAVPYSFYDAAARADVRLSRNAALEVSGTFARDRVSGDIPDVLHGTAARWGGGVVRGTIATPFHGLSARHTIGLSRYASVIENRPADSTVIGAYDAPEADPSRNGLTYVVARGELEQIAGSDAADNRGWSGGYELARFDVDFEGARPTSLAQPSFLPPLVYASTLDIASAWLQKRQPLGTAAVADLGVRADGGAAVRGRPRIGIEPRAAVRVRAGERGTVSLGVSRVWQYAQAVSSAGLVPVKGFASDFIWLLADDTVPAIRSDVITFGAERWIGERWIGAANTFVRREQGVAVSDPAPGPLVDRQLFVTGGNRARGLELSMRRLTGRWTGSASYTLSRSDMIVNGIRFPAPADQRHAFDATFALQLPRAWRVGAAYTWGSGTPYTRRYNGSVTCDAQQSCRWYMTPWQGAPNALRRGVFQSLDMSAEWARRYRGWQLGGFIQLRNVLNAGNRGRYVGVETICRARCGTDSTGAPFGFEERDEFLPGLPLLPLLGVQATF